MVPNSQCHFRYSKRIPAASMANPYGLVAELGHAYRGGSVNLYFGPRPVEFVRAGMSRPILTWYNPPVADATNARCNVSAKRISTRGSSSSLLCSGSPPGLQRPYISNCRIQRARQIGHCGRGRVPIRISQMGKCRSRRCALKW